MTNLLHTCHKLTVSTKCLRFMLVIRSIQISNFKTLDENRRAKVRCYFKHWTKTLRIEVQHITIPSKYLTNLALWWNICLWSGYHAKRFRSYQKKTIVIPKCNNNTFIPKSLIEYLWIMKNLRKTKYKKNAISLRMKELSSTD